LASAWIDAHVGDWVSGIVVPESAVLQVVAQTYFGGEAGFQNCFKNGSGRFAKILHRVNDMPILMA
jgi:hypothetical protein